VIGRVTGSAATATGVPGRAPLILAPLVLVPGVANLDLAMANVVPDTGTSFDASRTGRNLVYPMHDKELALLDQYHRIDGTVVTTTKTSAGAVQLSLG